MFLRGNQVTVFASLLFGLGSWIAVNGIYAELSVLAPHIPEGYNIYSWAGIMVAFGNGAATLLYFFVRYYKSNHLLFQISAFLIGFGALSVFFLAFFWDVQIGGGTDGHSIVLILILFLSGSVDCSTTITFYPAIQLFSPPHITSLSIGESLTGSVSALLGIAQTTGEPYGETRFSPMVFFLSLTFVMGLSGVGLGVLYHNYKKVAGDEKRPLREVVQDPMNLLTPSEIDDMMPGELEDGGYQDEYGNIHQSSSSQPILTKNPTPTFMELFFICSTFFFYSFCENGILVILPPFATGHYPNPNTFEKWAVYSMLITAPFGSAFAHFGANHLKHYTTRLICVIIIAIFSYWIVLASTVSPGSSSNTAAVLVLLSFPITKLTIAFAKTLELLYIRNQYEDEQLSSISRTSAYSMQLGACVGSVLFFILTTITNAISIE
jgi:hypothetical protein